MRQAHRWLGLTRKVWFPVTVLVTYHVGYVVSEISSAEYVQKAILFGHLGRHSSMPMAAFYWQGMTS